MSAVSPEISAYMADLARRRAAGRDMRAQGRLGGKPRKPAKCKKCGVDCSSTREAGAHCRVKRVQWVEGRRKEWARYTAEVRAVDYMEDNEVADSLRRAEFAAFERANGPWVSPEAARQAWEQLQQDLTS